MRRIPAAAAYLAAVPVAATLLTLLQVSASTGRAFRDTVPHPLFAAWICWLLWAPLVPALAWTFRRFVGPSPGRPAAVATVAVTTLAATVLHAALTALTAALLAPIFGAARAPFAVEVATLLPKSLFAALPFALATLAFESIAAQRRAERRALEAEAAQLQAELEALRRQLAPHLLFNALNALVVELRKGNAEAAEEGLIALSRLLRRVLELGRRPTVPLAEELDVLADYLAIARLRLRDGLVTSIDAAPDTCDIAVPTLLLQPLVENALEHGKVGGGRPLTLVVTARRQDDRLLVTVNDDGAGLPPGFDLDRDAGIGLSMVADRLRLSEPGPGRLALANRPTGGVEARLELPIVSASEETPISPHSPLAHLEGGRGGPGGSGG